MVMDMTCLWKCWWPLFQFQMSRADGNSSHPESPRYGQWYSPEEVIDIFAPPKHAVDAVRQWLHDSNISPERISQSTNKQWIQFNANVQEAERLLKTKYHQYEHLATGKTNVACEEYYVPQHIQQHIDYITPGLKLIGGGSATEEKKAEMEKRGFRTSSNQNFSSPILKGILPPAIRAILALDPTADCGAAVTPECIALMYKIPKATRKTPGNELGIFEEGDFYAAEDLVAFFALYAQNIPLLTRPILKGVDGGFAPGLVAGGESDLDFQISCKQFPSVLEFSQY